jgi:sulfotransferase
VKHKIHFLAGLPRSGNTLLSAVLNQNPSIYSSPLSSLSTGINELDFILKSEFCIRNKENLTRGTNALNNYAESFYSDVEESIIFDREKNWCSPDNLNLIRNYITPEPKIVFTVRSITDIIASYIDIKGERLVYEMANHNFNYKHYCSTNDAISEYLMRPKGQIDNLLLSLSYAFRNVNKRNILIVEYDDMVNDMPSVMKKIYNFIGEPQYEHDFTDIKKLEVDDDLGVNDPADLHKVRNSISPSEIKASNLLSDYILDKYKNANFWRDDSIQKIVGRDL